MTDRRTPRGKAVVVAAALFGLLVSQVALVGASGPGNPRASASSNLNRKLKIVNRKLYTLSKRVGQLEQQITALEGQGTTAGPPTGPAGGALSGQYPNPGIGTGAVGSAEVADNSLTGTDFLDGSLGIAELSASIPAVRVMHSIDQGAPNGTYTLLHFNQERYDTAAMHSGTISNSRLTAPVTGIYELSANVEWESLVGGSRSMVLVRNGEGTTGGTWIAAVDEAGKAGGAQAQALSTVARLQAGDYVELLVRQITEASVQAGVHSNENSEGSFVAPSEYTPEFSMTWLAPGP
jgi:hypothetical protein